MGLVKGLEAAEGLAVVVDVAGIKAALTAQEDIVCVLNAERESITIEESNAQS